MSKFPAGSFPFVVVLTLGLVASWSLAGAAPEDFQARAGDPQVAGNVDGPPRFPRNPRRSATTSSPADFRLMPHRRAEAIDTGDPSARCNDLDGSRNDMGFSGGPFAPGSRILPGDDACGAPL